MTILDFIIYRNGGWLNIIPLAAYSFAFVAIYQDRWVFRDPRRTLYEKIEYIKDELFIIAAFVIACYFVNANGGIIFK